MLAKSGSILPLPADVAKQINSSTAIPSLNSVVVGLFKNSLDAGARRIDVHIDYGRGACTVEDDGQGIAPSEFAVDGGLARQHRGCARSQCSRILLTSIDTSKASACHPVHGQSGTFLSSVAALSILTITSHHHLNRSHATLVLHRSRPAARLVPAPAYHQLSCRDHGTKVGIQDLFGNMPVRLKQRSVESKDGKEHERLLNTACKEVVGLLLAWGSPIDVNVRASEGIRKLCVRGRGTLGHSVHNLSISVPAFSLPLIRTILSHAAYIDPSSWDDWVRVSACTPMITMKGAISLEPAPSKSVQFISLGIHMIDPCVAGNVLYDEVNHLFATSRFGAKEDIPDIEDTHSIKPDRRRKQDGHTGRQLKGGGKGVDRWPMFYIQINIHDEKASNPTPDLLKTQSTLSITVKVLAAMISGFLVDYHFQTRKRPSTNRQRPKQLSTVVVKMSPSAPASPRPEPRLEQVHSRKRSNFNDRAKLPLQSRRSSLSNPLPNILKTRNSRLGILADDVQIPKLSRAAPWSSTDVFSSWSRIKSGSRNVSHEVAAQMATSESLTQPCPSDRPSSFRSNSHMALSSLVPNDRSNTLLIGSEEGALGTPDMAGHAGAAEASGEVIALRETRDGLASDAAETVALEEAIPWINPISKATVLINARTGLAVTERLVAMSHNLPSAHVLRDSTMSLNLRIPSRSPLIPFASAKEDSWVSGFLRDWENPIFNRTEGAIPQLSSIGPSLEASTTLHGACHPCSHTNMQHAFAESSSSLSTKLSKDNLRNARIISQIERKFVLVCMNATISEPALLGDLTTDDQVLILIDQHAADERVRVEALLAELCAPPSQGSGSLHSALDPSHLQSTIATTVLEKPIIFDVPRQEHRLFTNHRRHFANWGILYGVTLVQQSSSMLGSSVCRLSVRTLPEAIAERCRLNPKVVIELMRNEVWKREESGQIASSSLDTVTDSGQHDASPLEKSWLSRIRDCPQSIIDMVNSRSCRSAIMFNDGLTIDDCRLLIQKLAMCAFPFQCAHGRPSMVPLVDLASRNGDPCTASTAFGSRGTAAAAVKDEIGFSQAWTKWKR